MTQPIDIPNLPDNTGLTDKTGRPIYLRDIVQVDSDDETALALRFVVDERDSLLGLFSTDGDSPGVRLNQAIADNLVIIRSN